MSQKYPVSTLITALTLALCASSSFAQQLYRHVDADGRVTYTDRAPSINNSTVTRINASGSSSQKMAHLPYELREVATRYPVNFYTKDNCAPCNSGRDFLRARGIPFTEFTVNTPEDMHAYKKISDGSNSFPFLRIGGQKITGFSSSDWGSYLDAAGYPSESKLPSTYTAAAAAPLAPLPPASAKTEPTNTEPTLSAPPPPPPTRTKDNPSGIIF